MGALEDLLELGITSDDPPEESFFVEKQNPLQDLLNLGKSFEKSSDVPGEIQGVDHLGDLLSLPEPSVDDSSVGQSRIKDIRNSLARGALTDGGFYHALEGATRLTRGLAQDVENITGGIYKPLPVAKRAFDWYAEAVSKTRQDIREALPVSEEFQRSLGGQVLQGIGQMGAVLPTFMIPGVGPAYIVGQIYQEGYDDAKAHGLDDADAHRAGMANTPAAALEYLGDRIILGKLLKPLRGKIRLRDVARGIALSSGSEGSTEALQTLWQNIMAKQLVGYDPERELTDDMINSAIVGSIVGGTVTAGGSAGTMGIEKLSGSNGRKGQSDIITSREPEKKQEPVIPKVDPKTKILEDTNRNIKKLEGELEADPTNHEARMTLKAYLDYKTDIITGATTITENDLTSEKSTTLVDDTAGLKKVGDREIFSQIKSTVQDEGAQGQIEKRLEQKELDETVEAVEKKFNVTQSDQAKKKANRKKLLSKVEGKPIYKWTLPQVKELAATDYKPAINEVSRRVNQQRRLKRMGDDKIKSRIVELNKINYDQMDQNDLEFLADRGDEGAIDVLIQSSEEFDVNQMEKDPSTEFEKALMQVGGLPTPKLEKQFGTGFEGELASVWEDARHKKIWSRKKYNSLDDVAIQLRELGFSWINNADDVIETVKRKYVQGQDVYPDYLVDPTQGQDLQFSKNVDEKNRARAAASGQSDIGLARSRVQDIEDTILKATADWKTSPKYNVVGSYNDLAPIYKTKVTQEDEGFYDPKTDEVFLIADQIKDRDRAKKVLFHEVIGHKGMKTILGDRYNDFMSGVAKRYSDRNEFREIADTYGLDLSKDEDKIKAAEETIARLSEGTIEDQSLWNRIVAAIKRFYRQNFGGEISEDEIKDTLARANRLVKKGGKKLESKQKVEDESITDELFSGVEGVDYNSPATAIAVSRRYQFSKSEINKAESKQPLKFFHAIKNDDLLEIKNVGNKLIAPSFRVTTEEKAIGRVGDIVFVVPKRLLQKYPIYDRDVWSATIKSVPSKLFIPNLSMKNKATRVLYKYGRNVYGYLVNDKNNIIGRDDAAYEFYRLEMQSDADLYNAAEQVAKEMDYDYDENDPQGSVWEPLTGEIFGRELPRTPENIAKWQKAAFLKTGGDKGVGSFFQGGQRAAREIPFKELSEDARKYLVSTQGEEKLSSKLFKKHQEAREEFSSIVSLPSSRGMIDDALAGEWAAMDLEDFKNDIKGIYGNELRDTGLELGHEILQEAYRDLPTKYFENKTYDAYNLNDFPNVIVTVNDSFAREQLKEMGYTGKFHNSFDDYFAQADPDEIMFSRKSLNEQAELIQDEIGAIEAQLEGQKERGEKPSRDLMGRRNVLRAEFNDLLMKIHGEVPALKEGKVVSMDEYGGKRTLDLSKQTDRESYEVMSDIEGATLHTPTLTQRWMSQLKMLIRGFGSPIPELPVTGIDSTKFILFKEGYRLIKSGNNVVRKKAADEIEELLQPIIKLGRKTIDPTLIKKRQDLVAKRKKYREQNRDLSKLNNELARVESQLQDNPFYLFQSAVLYRDLWYRSLLENKDGRPIQLPGGLSADAVKNRLSEIHDQIANSKYKDQIEESLKGHYTLVSGLQKELLDHGHIIPEDMRNPLYFPHHVLDYFTGRLDRIMPTTSEVFRPYLVDPTGSTKQIEADYLKAMYHHVVEVRAHNARQDIVQQKWKPLDEAKRLQAELDARGIEEGRGVPKEAWKNPSEWPKNYELITVDDQLPLRMDYLIDRSILSKRLGVELGDGDLRQRLKEAGVELNIKAEDLEAAFTAGEKNQWLVPKEIAAAIRGIRDREKKSAEQNKIGSFSGTTMRAWKMNILFSPLNYPRYEFNNTVTDIGKLWSVNPGLFKELPAAAREVSEFFKGGKPSKELEQAFKRGVIDSVTAAEVGQLKRYDQFADFLSDKELTLERVKKVLTMTLRLARLREATFRYAKFKHDVERMRNGGSPIYAGAYWRDVEAMEGIYEKAAFISRRTFGDYEDISVSGSFIRKHLQPFYSWTEINFRYNANLFRNFYDMIKLGEWNEARTIAGQGVRSGISLSSRVAAGALTRLMLPYLAIQMWNNFGGAAMGVWDDDDDLESTLTEYDRKRFHILLGKDSDGKTMVIYAPTALSDLMEWFGGNNFSRLAGEFLRKEIDLYTFVTDFAKQVPIDFGNELIQGIRPGIKALYTGLSGKNPFPDVFNQRTVSKDDMAWVIFSGMTDRHYGLLFRNMLDRDYYSPNDVQSWWQQTLLQVRRRDPEMWSYYEIRDKAADYLWVMKGEKKGYDYTSTDQQTLRSFRKAMYNADVKAAIKFYNLMLGMGYTSERFTSSLQAQDPLSGLSKELRRDFLGSLTDNEAKMLNRAMRYYARIAVSKGQEKQLFPRKRDIQWGREKRPDYKRLTNIIREQSNMSDSQMREFADQLIRESTTRRR